MGRKRFSRAVERAIFKRARGLCQICASPTEFDYGEVDHIVAKSKGGSDYPKNLQWTCHRCNKLKGSNLSNEDIRQLLSLPLRFEEIMELKAKEQVVEKIISKPSRIQPAFPLARRTRHFYNKRLHHKPPRELLF